MVVIPKQRYSRPPAAAQMYMPCRGDIPWPACPDSHRTLLYELCWYTYSFPRDDIRDWVRRPKRLLGLSFRFWVWGKRAWLP